MESKEQLLRFLAFTLRKLYPNLLRFEFSLDRDVAPSCGMVPGENGATVNRPGAFGLIRDVSADMHFAPALHGVRRGLQMSAPLLEGRTALGLIVVEAVPGKPFTSMDLAILESVAGMFSLALQRLRSREAEQRRASMELDRRSARDVQRSLMHGSLPAEVGVTVDARYLPAMDVGGDFYELSHLGGGRVGGAIGDVSGKGVSAALIMARVSSDVGRAIRSGAEPSKVLETVNTTLSDSVGETFVTASCISLDARCPSLTVANAGHVPLMVRRATGEVFEFGGASGTPLGMMPCQYVDERVELRPRDIVLLMTDGLVEAFDAPDDSAGAARLHRIVASAPHDPRAINDHVLAAAHDVKGPRSLDDVTLVALQIEPQ